MALSTLCPLESIPQTALTQVRQELGDANLTVGQVAGTHKHIKTETFGQKLTLAEITFIW